MSQISTDCIIYYYYCLSEEQLFAVLSTCEVVSRRSVASALDPNFTSYSKCRIIKAILPTRLSSDLLPLAAISGLGVSVY